MDKALSVIPEEFVERLAIRTHEHYLADLDELVPGKPSHRPWRELPGDIQLQNRDQVRDIIGKLSELGYCVIQGEEATERVDAFPEDIILEMSKWEHDRWQKWADKEHPDHIDWVDLSEEVRSKDIRPMRRIPQVLSEVGLAIVPCPPGRS